VRPTGRESLALLALQRQAGNRAVVALVGRTLSRCRGACTCGGGCREDEALLEDRSKPAKLLRQSKAPVADRNAEAASLCAGEQYFRDPPTIPFAGRERSLAEATRWSARSVAASAAQALASGDDFLRTRAAQVLHEDNADLDELAETARRIHQALVDTPFERGTCSNSVCTNERADGVRTGGVMADAAEDRSRITICPFFFAGSHSLGELVRTWLHEGGHIAGIDDPPSGQPYEHPPNCQQQRGENPFEKPKPYDCAGACPGGDKNNVDNWAYFLDCIGRGA
jgi:hypothetical protein